jgi:hypothetical protein
VTCQSSRRSAISSRQQRVQRNSQPHCPDLLIILRVPGVLSACLRHAFLQRLRQRSLPVSWVMARVVSASRLDVARQAEGFRYCTCPWGPNLLGASCSSRFRLRYLEAHLALLILVAFEIQYCIGVCTNTTCIWKGATHSPRFQIL